MGDTHFGTLPDGRRVSYSDHGDPAGPPVLSCLGTPESRLLDPALIADAERAGVRLVPDAATRWPAARIPGAELTRVRGGHGLTDETWPEVFGWLREHAKDPR